MSGLRLFSVALELPQLHLFAPFLSANDAPLMFSMVLTRPAYERTPEAIADLLAESDVPAFAQWFHEALRGIDV
jgi:hypothetical protein